MWAETRQLHPERYLPPLLRVFSIGRTWDLMLPVFSLMRSRTANKRLRRRGTIRLRNWREKHRYDPWVYSCWKRHRLWPSGSCGVLFWSFFWWLITPLLDSPLHRTFPEDESERAVSPKVWLVTSGMPFGPDIERKKDIGPKHSWL